MTLQYTVEALYTQMLRKNVPDPYGAAELKTRISEIHWQRMYTHKCITFLYPELCKNAGSDLAAQVKSFIASPLAFYKKTEGVDRDATWIQNLPTEPLRLFMKHLYDL